jgi:S1-C subfamily serine protease
MTNSHVCGLEENGTILGRYQGSDYVLNVIKKFPMNDLCVLSAPKTAKQYFKVASSFKLGESSYAIGYPQLEPLSLVVGELSDLLTVRVVTKINGTPQECTGPTYEYTTDLPPEAMIFGVFSTCVRSVQANSSSMIISPGNSGSPVVNIWGSVIGVVFAANQFGTRSYIVPLSDLKLFLKDL